MGESGNNSGTDERRKSNRIDAHAEGLQAVDSIDGQSLGIIGNLSADGLMLIASRHLHADGILQLTIAPPPGLGFEPVRMGVKILWCTPANSPDQYWAGLETIDLSDGDRDALLRLLDHLAAPQ